MATQPLAPYKLYGYVSDDQNTYQVKLQTTIAAAGGFGAAVTAGTYPDLPENYRMRYQLGKTTTDKLGKVPIAGSGSDAWKVPVAWTGNNAVAYTPTGGCVGEKRKAVL